MQIKGFRGPQEIAEILERCLEWDFDIFKLEILTEKRYLVLKKIVLVDIPIIFFIILLRIELSIKRLSINLSGCRPLLFLGTTIMNLYRVPARLGCEEKVVQNWLTVIEMNYQSRNSYHNSTHAADVLQATARFMQSERLQQILEPLDEVATLVAAAAHDVDHPGRSR